MIRISHIILVSLLIFSATTIVDAASNRKQIRQAREDLKAATKTGKTEKFRKAMNALLKLRGPRELESVLESFARIVEEKLEQGTIEYFEFFSRIAKALGKLDDKKEVKELNRLRKAARSWPARLIIMECANFSDALDIRELALEALHDKSPTVVQRSLHYLRNADKDLAVIDAVLARYLKVDEDQAYAAESWDHARIAFRDALSRLLRIVLGSAVDYKNYYEPRRDNPDLFNPPPQQGASRLNLFGAPITGKNVVFILDRSASMLATDKITIAAGRKRERTRVRDDKEIAARKEKRRRITRARNELIQVIKALPEGMNFNILTYSSSVEEWQTRPVEASPDNKKKAARFVKKVEADGVTVTDWAISRAFSNLTIDTIYLITDGAPSHIGGQKGKQLPSDSEKIIKQILKDVPIYNYLRGVRIFTLGFPEAEEKFLKKLAKRNSGTYTPIK
jgi:hypothetical protein